VFVAAYAMALRQKPATHRCASHDEARRWVEVQAAELGVPVELADGPLRPLADDQAAASPAVVSVSTSSSTVSHP
jgi:hypothetical protein